MIVVGHRANNRPSESSSTLMLSFGQVKPQSPKNRYNQQTVSDSMTVSVGWIMMQAICFQDGA